MPARPPFPQTIGIRAAADLPDQLVADASMAVGVVGLSAVERLDELGLTLPRRVDVYLHAGGEVPGMPGMGGQTEFLSRRRVIIRLALDAADSWDDLKLIMLCHEFGHLVAGSLPNIAPVDLAYLVEEYLAEREAWELLWRSAAAPDEATFATLARVHYEGGLSTASLGWRRVRAELARAIEEGRGREGVRRFRDETYSIVRLLAYGVADAQRAGLQPTLTPALPAYVAALVSPILSPLESVRPGGPLIIDDFPALRMTFTGLLALAENTAGELALAAIRRMSEAHQEALLALPASTRPEPR